LSWAANTGTKSYSWWYPDFESITGVSLSAAGNDDVQLYWYCKGENPNGHCDGLEAPCGRSCGNSAFTADGDSAENESKIDWIWIVFGVVFAMMCCVVIGVCIRRKRMKGSVEFANDTIMTV